ncbi:Pycsar system effector family protein [Reyranella sp.]|uniref:Pycsar system effector family protein n=1 Tax=Reyranella sp. TaxID=1929291 RepID=UPI002721FBA2|nr:Pycsar system effector family protein [Reyranella sp.]MDO8975874.1 DUF5706 domain-containing protein [Reyranella sp.]
MDNKEKRDFSAKHLDRVLGFFARVEAKASFLFAINTTLLALIALNLRKSDLSLWYVMVPGIAAVLLLVVSLWFIYQCHFPKLEGGSGSLVYFAEISKRTELGFVNECEAVSEEALIKDYLGQTWRNAQILTAKFGHVKAAFTMTGLALVPWFLFLVATSITNAETPLLR